MGADSPAFKRRVSSLMDKGCDNEKAVATVTRLTTEKKQSKTS